MIKQPPNKGKAWVPPEHQKHKTTNSKNDKTITKPAANTTASPSGSKFLVVVLDSLCGLVTNQVRTHSMQEDVSLSLLESFGEAGIA